MNIFTASILPAVSCLLVAIVDTIYTYIRNMNDYNSANFKRKSSSSAFRMFSYNFYLVAL